MAHTPPSPGKSPYARYSPADKSVPAQADPLPTSSECLERFARTFEASARRWEMVVYPSLFAFIVLAAYGFFLIYSLTQDVSSLAVSVKDLTVSVDSMSDNMDTVSNRMQAVSLNMDEISHKMDNLGPMRASMENIDRSTQVMSITTDGIRRDMTGMNVQMAGMNRTIRPMRTFGSFMPW